MQNAEILSINVANITRILFRNRIGRKHSKHF